MKLKLESMVRDKIGYRNESLYGSKVRDIREIIEFEIAELGNTDIPYTLLDTFAINEEREKEIEEYIAEIEDGNFDNIETLVDWCIATINKNYDNPRYCLWLASKNAIIKNYEGTEDNIIAYEIDNDLPISDLGFNEQGCLFVYSKMPTPIKDIV